MENYLVLDIGGTAIKFAIADKEANFKEKGSIKTYPDSFEKQIEEIGKTYDELKKRYLIKGIAISSPGFVDGVKGITYGTSALPCIMEKEIARAIHLRMDGLPISMENDGNCGGLGEYWKGRGRGKKNIVMLVCGSGIGGGYVREGKIDRTIHHASAEFGFMPMVFEEGKVKSWSSCSVVNILKKYLQEVPSSISGKELFDLAEKDNVAKKYVDKFYYHLALGCISVGFALDPDLIIIGGAISKRRDFETNIREQIRKIKSSNFEFSCNKTDIAVAELGNDANLYGALYNFLYVRQCEVI